MRLSLLGLLVGVAVFPSSATADQVVVLGPGGHAAIRNDPFLTVPPVTPAPTATRARAAAGSAAPGQPHRRRGRHRRPQRTVFSVLAHLYKTNQISQAQYYGYRGSWGAGLRTERNLHGTRKAELAGVTENLHNIAAAGMLTPSRLPALFLTLDRNRQWWSSGPMLAYGQRVEFIGSPLVWEYYPGQGVELTMLGNFSKVDGLYTAGPSQYSSMQSLLGDLIPLAADRGGKLAWEYYFKFDGGSPPWVSAMAQGTAIEALTRAYEALGPQQGASYLQIAQQALGLLTTPPPVGAGVATSQGWRFVQYSFAPARNEEVINAFLQTLIGLYDYAHASGDAMAGELFNEGNAEAQAELPQFDTGAWSLYQPGQEDTLDYHELVTGFLQHLCADTSAPVYCTTAQHFQAYLTTPPVLALETTHVRARRTGTIRFTLSKVSHVGIVILRGSQTVFETSAQFPYGTQTFSIPRLRRRGLYSVRLAATDLAGNFSRITGTVQAR